MRIRGCMSPRGTRKVGPALVGSFSFSRASQRTSERTRRDEMYEAWKLELSTEQKPKDLSFNTIPLTSRPFSFSLIPLFFSFLFAALYALESTRRAAELELQSVPFILRCPPLSYIATNVLLALLLQQEQQQKIEKKRFRDAGESISWTVHLFANR